LPDCRAAEERTGRSAKATIPRCLKKEIMGYYGETSA
jgi:hypothetical protein